MINTRVRGCVCSVGMRCMGHVAVPRTSSVGAYGIGSFSLSAFPVLAEVLQQMPRRFKICVVSDICSGGCERLHIQTAARMLAYFS